MTSSTASTHTARYRELGRQMDLAREHLAHLAHQRAELVHDVYQSYGGENSRGAKAAAARELGVTPGRIWQYIRDYQQHQAANSEGGQAG